MGRGLSEEDSGIHGEIHACQHESCMPPRILIYYEEVDRKIMPGVSFTDDGLLVVVPWSKVLKKGDYVVCLAADVFEPRKPLGGGV